MSAHTIPFILLLLFFTIVDSRSHTCPPSSCGKISDISYPFRLKTDPTSCGFNNTLFELDCHNNQTVMDMNPKRYVGSYNDEYMHLLDSQIYETVIHPSPTWYYVKEINYQAQLITVVDPSRNVSSCPLHFNFGRDGWFNKKYFDYLPADNSPVVFIHCLSQGNSSKYVEAPFCGNRSSVFSNSSKFYSYVMVSDRLYQLLLDLEESCTVDSVNWVSAPDWTMKKNTSLKSFYDALPYGINLGYSGIFPKKCYCCFYLNLGPQYKGRHAQECSCYSPPYQPLICVLDVLAPFFVIYGGWITAALVTLRLLVGFPLFIWLVVNKWRRRHLCMDKSIEEFLQSEQNLAPIKYTYSEIKKMTNNFAQQLGEGGFGVVYKGKLRSGPSVAIKVMEQSMGSEEEFINEVATIGQIHHVNVVQLIGFCVERSKCALVYEFLPNGSLDRYIFNQESLGGLALTYEKMFEIALGVARGIDYLHHGCNMQILHFDIKPHNILLDEKFNPKISDFGLAQLHPTNESFMNLTAARGTMGYMAPEMFYNNFRGITYKADIYSFGMMLMEMASRRKNMIPLANDDSQMYFPSWAYDQLRVGKYIEIKDVAQGEKKMVDVAQGEKKMVKKIIIVGLWCIQMRPSARPPMNKVVEMLEGKLEPRMPPKPFVSPHEMAIYDQVTNKTWRTTDYVTWDVPVN